MITIKDIAKHLNLSVSTVSRATNNHPDINQQTKEKVERAIKELNYIPSAYARNMVKKNTYTIGFMIPDIADSFFSGSAYGVEEYMAENGHEIFYGSTARKRDKLTQFLINAQERRFEGVIITPDRWDESLIEFIHRMSIPVIALRRKTPKDSKIPYVDANHYSGACQAVEHLIDLNHKHIGHIVMPTLVGDERYNGYKNTLDKYGLAPLSVTAQGTGLYNKELQAGKIAMEQLMSLNHKLTAVFAGNDRLAIGAMEYLHSIGKSVPEDISIIGFDNLDLADLFNIKLTTMAQAHHEMGRAAGKLLLSMIQNPTQEFNSVCLETNFIDRQSTRSI